MDTADRTATPRTGRIILLGSTGSIGVNTIEVVDHLRRHGGPDYEIVGLAAGRNGALLARQARDLGVDAIAIAEPSADFDFTGIGSVHAGSDSALELIRSIARPGDLIVGAMVGAAGIPPTIAALETGCDVALANKETLVAAGALVMPLAAAHGARILPVDSEHSAIFQCLRGGREHEVARLVLTASGGPFRSWSSERMNEASVEEALAHPTWSMGPKVTIDSASMMNKALELIEARWLFDVDGSRLDAVIHPQSIVHSFVEFIDGSVLAQLSPPDMKMPIQHALTWPERAEGGSPRVDWTSFGDLVFEPVDHERFPTLRMALEVIEAGGTAGAIFNAANEVAVQAFLEGRMGFGGIHQTIAATLDASDVTTAGSLEDITAADETARRTARKILEARV